MTTPGRSAVLLSAAGVVAALLALLLHLDRNSLERGNRLFRAGEVEVAADVYELNARGEAADPAAFYNTGTAELALGAPTAAERLEEAASGSDSVVAKLANYNLGYHYLSAVRDGMEPDSAVPLLRSSIQHSRSALRLDAAQEDARWNLALAQTRLDSILQLRLDNVNRSSHGTDDTPIDLQAVTRGIGEAQSGIEPEDARASEVLGQRIAAAQGAREAWTSQDPGPLSEESARELLQQVSHDPEQLLRGLMWAHRPDVAWWNSEPYPGGNW